MHILAIDVASNHTEGLHHYDFLCFYVTPVKLQLQKALIKTNVQNTQNQKVKQNGS